MTGTEIVKLDHGAVAALPIQGMQDISALGKYIAESGMIGVKSIAAGVVVASECHQKGLSILDFSRRYHVDNRGKVTMRSDRMLAEFMERGGTCKWITLADDKEKQTGEFTYGVNENYAVTFSHSEAVDAGYIKPGSNWEKDPAAQMRARVITRAVRMLCPGAVAGMYDGDEMQDVYNNETPTTQEPVEVDAATVENMEIKTETTAQTTVNVEPDPFDGVSDFTVCPIPDCSFTGMKWDDIPIEQLKGLKGADNPAITEHIKPGHWAEIDNIVNGK